MMIIVLSMVMSMLSLLLLSVKTAPFMFVRRTVVFFFLKVSPVKQKATSCNHCNRKLFICDLAVAKVIKKSLRSIFYQACRVLNIEQHKIADQNNSSRDYEKYTHS